MLQSSVYIDYDETANKCFDITDNKTRTVDIDRILEKVAAKSLDRVRPTKGEFDQDTNPEKIQEKLLERY